MSRVLTAIFAALGLIVSGGLASILLVGLLEGIRTLPDAVSGGAGVMLFLASMVLVGRVVVDVAREHAYIALGGVVVFVGMILAVLSVATEQHGEGMEWSTVAIITAGFGALLGSGVQLAHRFERRRHRKALGSP